MKERHFEKDCTNRQCAWQTWKLHEECDIDGRISKTPKQRGYEWGIHVGRQLILIHERLETHCAYRSPPEQQEAASPLCAAWSASYHTRFAAKW